VLAADLDEALRELLELRHGKSRPFTVARERPFRWIARERDDLARVGAATFRQERRDPRPLRRRVHVEERLDRRLLLAPRG